MSDLLHDALRRAQQQSQSPNLPPTAQLSSLALSDSDDELVEVRTPIATPSLSAASTPAHSRSTSPTRDSPSRSSTPGGSKRRGGAGKPRRDKTKEREKAEANAKSLDPLLKFPGEVNVRIFAELGVDDLLAAGLVCKRWRRSQTINWSWYCLLQSITYVSPDSSATGSKLPTWRKADSKVDWAARFASINRRDDLEKPNTELDEEGQTFQDFREQKWREENEDALAPADKVAMRQYYKSLGNAKIKGKTGKGMARTWDEDGLGGGGDDYI